MDFCVILNNCYKVQSFYGYGPLRDVFHSNTLRFLREAGFFLARGGSGKFCAQEVLLVRKIIFTRKSSNTYGL